MAAVNAYLNFNGNTAEAFNFYKSVFGGEFENFQRFSDMPDMEHLSEEEKSRVMHVSFPIGQTMLMGSDTLESMGYAFKTGNNFSLSVDTQSEEEADKIFNALAKGGNVTMPLEKTFWGAYFGMLTDKFGIQWMVNFG